MTDLADSLKEALRMTATELPGRVGLSEHGIEPTGTSIATRRPRCSTRTRSARGEGRLAEGGPLVVDTGTLHRPLAQGQVRRRRALLRGPDLVGRRSTSRSTEAHFEGLREKVARTSSGHDLYVVDAFAGADPAHRIAVRVDHELTRTTRCSRRRCSSSRPRGARATSSRRRSSCTRPSVEADPEEDGTRSGTFVVLHPTRTEVLIGGTFYAGEIKKSIFSLMNDRLPLEGVFPMHCSANVGDDGDVALFFGLSGTGKTTLSADPERSLIGDDEHGWGDDGVFNFEGGCYAKVIRLSAEAEPEIYGRRAPSARCSRTSSSTSAGILDLDDDSKTENTRAAYPLEQIANALPAKRAGHPQNVIFLTADAFGILPPIARLTPEQALYYFLSGYTAKLAGTEIGVNEPQPTFSACFGAPFLPQPPTVYARMLGEKLAEHGADGLARQHRLDGRAVRRGPADADRGDARAAPRALVRRARPGRVPDRPVFGFEVPVHVPGVDALLLEPRSTWRDPEAYDAKARELARMFRDNFAKKFADADEAVASAGPRP